MAHIKLLDLLMEDGALAGKMELDKISADEAYKYIDRLFKKRGESVDEEIPNFKQNFNQVQKMVKKGKTLRKDMPVINQSDIKDLQFRLSNGYIDVTEPHAPFIKGNNPFPEGLSGKLADRWLENGLKRHDGATSDDDDKVKVSRGTIRADKLKPIQKQIYFDKSAGAIGKSGVETSKAFVKSRTFIVSADNYIIDGHHRFLSAMLIDPKMSVSVMKIDLPLNILLPMALAYGDARGNKRNA